MLRPSLQALFALTLFCVAACVSVGEGTGEVVSDRLFARDCWDDGYDLRPNFFAADPFRNTMHIRLQRGSDFIELSDGLSILVDDIEAVRGQLGRPIPVTLQPGIAPPGLPPSSVCGSAGCDSPVHAALYLLESCHTQNIVLYGVDGTITFDELFSGDPNEEDAAEKLISGSFELTVVDSRDLAAGDVSELSNTSRLSGRFRFFFQRGQPAQPFP